MIQCRNCGAENKEDAHFCTNCGDSLVSKRDRQKSKGFISPKRIAIFLGLAALLLIAISGYQLRNQNSEVVVKEKFLQALNQRDEIELKEGITPSNERIKISRDGLQALFELLDQDPATLERIQDSLSNETLTNGLFSIRQKGKVFGMFPRYVIEPTGYLIEATAVGEHTMIMLNDQELGYLEKTGDTSEFGPFLPGVYHLKTVTMLGEEKVEEEVKMTLSGAETKKKLTFAKAEASKKKAQEATKVVVKEVPVGGYNNYYLIPYSDAVYLDTSDVSGLTQSELRLARSEIFARHGFVFKSTDLQSYFNTQAWYYQDPSFKGNLNELEQKNVNFIKSFE